MVYYHFALLNDDVEADSLASDHNHFVTLNDFDY